MLRLRRRRRSHPILCGPSEDQRPRSRARAQEQVRVGARGKNRKAALRKARGMACPKGRSGEARGCPGIAGGACRFPRTDLLLPAWPGAAPARGGARLLPGPQTDTRDSGPLRRRLPFRSTGRRQCSARTLQRGFPGRLRRVHPKRRRVAAVCLRSSPAVVPFAHTGSGRLAAGTALSRQ
jgi:hypothetical protein